MQQLTRSGKESLKPNIKNLSSCLIQVLREKENKKEKGNENKKKSIIATRKNLNVGKSFS